MGIFHGIRSWISNTGNWLSCDSFCAWDRFSIQGTNDHHNPAQDESHDMAPSGPEHTTSIFDYRDRKMVCVVLEPVRARCHLIVCHILGTLTVYAIPAGSHIRSVVQEWKRSKLQLMRVVKVRGAIRFKYRITATTITTPHDMCSRALAGNPVTRRHQL